MRAPALRGRGHFDQGCACLLAVLLLGGMPLACETTGDDTGDPTDTSGDDGGHGDDPVEYGLPQIIDPASDKIVLPVTRTEPLVIKVREVVPGVTLVVLDDRVLGTLSPATALGELREDTLTLELGGAMHVSRHTIVLVNPGPEGPLFSRTLLVSLVSLVDQPPVKVSALVESTLTQGHAITVDGTFDDALLTVVDEQTDDGVALAKIFRRQGEGWSETPRTVPLVGYARAPGEMRPPVSASWASRIDGGAEADVLRVAWRVGLAGESIAGVEIDASASQDGEVLTLMTSPAPFDGSSGLALEWAGYGAPRFFGGDLLVEMVALVDSESAHPGDHRLLQLRWPAPPASPGQLVAVVTSEVMDLDALGPGVDLLDPGRPLLALRARGRQPAFVRRALAGQAEVTVGAPALGSAPGASVQLLAVASSFGAWTTVELDASGALFTTWIDSYGSMENTVVSAELLPEALPSAAPSVALLAGLPHIAVPYGDTEAVHIAVPSDHMIRVLRLDGLFCDAVSLLIEDPSRSTGPFVCVYQGEVQIGTLTTFIE